MNRSTADLARLAEEAQATADAAYAEVARLHALVLECERRIVALEQAQRADPLTWPRDGDGREVPT